MVSSVFILITRIVCCSTNVLSVAALDASTSISALHNMLSARTPVSNTVTFEAVARGELRRFALAFIHSHSGATGVFRNAFREFVGEATSCLPKTLQTT